jgi:hypothetical protein
MRFWWVLVVTAHRVLGWQAADPAPALLVTTRSVGGQAALGSSVSRIRQALVVRVVALARHLTLIITTLPTVAARQAKAMMVQVPPMMVCQAVVVVPAALVDGIAAPARAVLVLLTQLPVQILVNIMAALIMWAAVAGRELIQPV